MRKWTWIACLAGWAATALVQTQSRQPENAVERLQAAIDAGATTLTYEEEFGYLRSVLAALDMPSPLSR